MKLQGPLRIACSLADRSYVWAGTVDGKILTAPSYVWAGHLRSGKIK